MIVSSGSAVLNHVRLLNNEADGRGGGLALLRSTATLTDTWVVSNTAPHGDLSNEGGGGVYVNGQDATFDASGGGIVSNTAYRGGGIFVYGGASATLKGTDVTSNRAQGEGKGGGGVYVGDEATFRATGGRIASNTAYGSGGGLFVDYPSSATLTQTDVTSNTAQGGGGVLVHATLRVSGGSMANNEAFGQPGQPGRGGAVQVFGPYGSATLTGTRVVSNTASGAGGGVFVAADATATLTETHVISNTATNGGGLSAARGDPSSFPWSSPSLLVHGGRVAGNAASSGGGIHVLAGSLTLTDVEILSNSAKLTESGAWSEPPGYGGGMLVLGIVESNPGVAALTGTVIVGNTASRGGGGICADGGTVSLGTAEVHDNQAPAVSNAINVRGGTGLQSVHGGPLLQTPGGTIASTTPLTITGDISQTAGTFSGSDHALRLEGALALASGDLYAPPTFTLTGPFTHTGGTYHQTRDVSGGGDVGFPKAGGVILNANHEALGATQVELTAASPCTVVSGAVISHCYVITPDNDTGRDAAVTFYYLGDEVPPAQACDEMEAYRWDAGWQPPLWRDARYGRRGRVCGGDPQSLRVEGVSTFSPFGLSQPPLRISKVVTPTSATPGDTITYTLAFSNTWSGTVTGVVITDVVPISVTNTSVLSNGVAITRRVGSRYVWDVRALDADGGGALTVTGVLSDPLDAGSFPNAADLASASAGEDPGGDRDEAWLIVRTREATAAPVVPTAGGSLVASDTQGLTTTVAIPGGAVSSTITLVHTPQDEPVHEIPGTLQFAGKAFDLTAYLDGVAQPGYQFKAPITITLHYSDEDVAGLDEATLVLHYWDGSAWVNAACGAGYDRHPDENWLAVEICHLTDFGLVGRGRDDQTGTAVGGYAYAPPARWALAGRFAALAAVVGFCGQVALAFTRRR